jgi:tripartite-type tricarboxylate transporter receptor subunit TctC
MNAKRKPSRARHIAAYGIVMACVGAIAPVLAQNDAADGYPSKPVRLIVPFVPGGGTDLVSRAIAQRLSEAWGQPVLVANHGGANGTIGVELAAKAPPDGYTLILISASQSVNVSLYKNLTYDLTRDFAPVTQVTTQPYVLVVNPALPVDTVNRLVDLAKAKPDTLNYGSSGIGGLSHLSGALFAALTSIRITHVPFRGGAPAMESVVGGHIDLLFSTLLQSRAQIAAGKLRALAVTTDKRSPAAPELPTMAEAGVPGFAVAGWYGILAPAGTPAPIVARLNRDIVRVLRLPEVRERLAADGSEPVGSTSEDFGAHIKSEIAKWRKVIAEADVKPE